MKAILVLLLFMIAAFFAFPRTARAQGYESPPAPQTTTPKTTTAPRKPTSVPSKSKCPPEDMKCLAIEEQTRYEGPAPSYEEPTGRKKK